jgi:integrase
MSSPDQDHIPAAPEPERTLTTPAALRSAPHSDLSEPGLTYVPVPLQVLPLFLVDRRAPAGGRRAPAAEDICPATGRGRLSYPRAEYLFKQASAALDPHKKGWTLHQLRHSALQHLAADGRTAPELQAKSRHQHLASLGRYVRLGEQTSARVTAEADPAARRRTR